MTGVKIEKIIDNDFGRNWVTSQYAIRRGVYLILPYIDINDGNQQDGTIFSQIMYWHEPDDYGETRLRRTLDGNYWLAKNHSEWFKETRIRSRSVRKCLDRIKERELIHYELHGEIGNITPYMRVNWQEFERRMRLWIQNIGRNIDELTYDNAIKIFQIKGYQATLGVSYELLEILPQITPTPVPPGQGGQVISDVNYDVLTIPSQITPTPVPTGHTPLSPQDIPLSPQDSSNTESTTKTLDQQTPAPENSAGLQTENDDVSAVVVIEKTTPRKKAKSSEPRPRNPMYDAILDIWKYSAAMNGLMAKMLTGMATANGWKQYNVDPPITDTDLRAWASWYRANKLSGRADMNMVEERAKIQSSIAEWRSLSSQRVPTVLDNLKIVRVTDEEREALYGRS